MDQPPKVESLTEFMSWVASTRPTIESEHVLFYRGHADWEYKLEPSVYRNNNKGESFRFVEHNLYEEMLRREPMAFSEDKTVFERLVRMQHHELPTRLLDLTHSPLIALYFACCDDNDNKDGEVIFFPRLRSQVDYPDNVPETALVGIEQPVEFDYIAKQISDYFRDYFHRLNPRIIDRDDFSVNLLALIERIVAILDGITKHTTDLLIVSAAFRIIEKELLIEFIDKWKSQFSSEALKDGESTQNIILAKEYQIAVLELEHNFNNARRNYINILCEKLRIRHSDYTQYIYSFLQQFTFLFFVYAPINNERIRRQQGAFVIFPPGKTEYWNFDNMQEKTYRVRIAGSAKKRILSELTYLGITKSYVFPELSVLAADVKMLYGPR